jgi:16S rRNA (cytidine1402-2'-O)-methyltransferase
LAILGDRPACIAREVTKLHEEFRRGKIFELVQSLEEHPAKGEITLLIGPPETGPAQVDTAKSLAARVDELMHQVKLDRKEALKLAAKERGITKRDAYRQLLDEGAEER